MDADIDSGPPLSKENSGEDKEGQEEVESEDNEPIADEPKDEKAGVAADRKGTFDETTADEQIHTLTARKFGILEWPR